MKSAAQILDGISLAWWPTFLLALAETTPTDPADEPSPSQIDHFPATLKKPTP